MQSVDLRPPEKESLTWKQRWSLGADKLNRLLADWRRRQAFRSEFARLDAAGQLESILDDMGLVRGDLARLARGYPQSERLFRGMAYQLDVGLDDLDPASLQELRHTCALCSSHGACRRWLAAAKATRPAFCLNLPLFDAARERGSRRRATARSLD